MGNIGDEVTTQLLRLADLKHVVAEVTGQSIDGMSQLANFVLTGNFDAGAIITLGDGGGGILHGAQRLYQAARE